MTAFSASRVATLRRVYAARVGARAPRPLARSDGCCGRGSGRVGHGFTGRFHPLEKGLQMMLDSVPFLLMEYLQGDLPEQWMLVALKKLPSSD